MTAPRVLLASGSPRRRKLLEAAGFAVEVKEPKIDDGAVHVHESVPARLVISLAWFKASQVAVVPTNVVALVAADTVCDVEGVVLGKPADRAAAAAMLASMFDSSHTTRTGVCIRSVEGRLLFEDASIVSMGPADAGGSREVPRLRRMDGQGGGLQSGRSPPSRVADRVRG